MISVIEKQFYRLAKRIKANSSKFFEEISILFNTIYEAWQSIEHQYSKPGTLTGVQRGIKYLRTSFVKKKKSVKYHSSYHSSFNLGGYAGCHKSLIFQK